MPGMDETALVQRACRLEQAAISALYRRHVQAIYRYIYYRVGDVHIAEDLTAEVFLRAIEGLPNYEAGETPFVAWLYRIAQARVADHFRQKQRARTTDLQENWSSDEDPLPARVEQSFRQQKLREAISQLTPDQQQVILLKFVEGLKNREIAKILGKTEGAVKSLQRRALNALQRLMERTDEKRRA